MSLLRSLLALGLLLPALALAESKRIAVLEFAVGDVGVDRKTVEDLTDSARGGAIDGTRGLAYVVMTREVVEEILSSNAKACVEAECELELGRAVGAHLLVTGVLSRAGAEYAVTLKLHDTVKGVPLAIRQFTGATWVALRPLVKVEARKLLEQGLGIDVERLSKGWKTGAAITGAGSLVALAGLGGVVYGLKVSRDWERQQPGQPGYDDRTVTRADAARARTIYWAGWGAAAVGAGVAWYGVRHILQARASVETPLATVAPIPGGAMAVLTWELP